MDKPLTLEDALVMVVRMRAVEWTRGLERFLRTRCVIDVRKQKHDIELTILISLPDDDGGVGEGGIDLSS